MNFSSSNFLYSSMLIDRALETSKDVKKLLEEIISDSRVILALKYSVKNYFPQHKELLTELIGSLEYSKEDFINAGEIDFASRMGP